jgi:hypothetical protein
LVSGAVVGVVVGDGVGVGTGFGVAVGVGTGCCAGAGGLGDVGKYKGPFLPQPGSSARAVNKQEKTRKCRGWRI